MDKAAKRVIFNGHVQGVGFRYTSRRIADRFDVTGFVRNLPDGTVEMLVQGPPQQVDACIQEVRESFDDNIRDSKIEQIPWQPTHTDFRIAH